MDTESQKLYTFIELPVFILLFSKNEQANLSADQVKQVAAVVEKIKEEISRRIHENH